MKIKTKTNVEEVNVEESKETKQKKTNKVGNFLKSKKYIIIGILVIAMVITIVAFPNQTDVVIDKLTPEFLSGFVSATSFDQDDERPIGYEFLNSSGDVVLYADADTVHIWNNASGVQDYYFEKESGIQLTNNFQDYWTQNVFCAGYKDLSDEWIYDCNDALPFNWDIDSDDLTYVNITGWRDKTIGTKEVRLGLRYHLKLNDQNLSVQLSVENIGAEDIDADLGFAWRIKDIQIPGVNVSAEMNDKILIDDTEYWLSESLDLSFTNLDEGYFKIFDVVEKSNLWLRWNKNLNYKVEVKDVPSQYNAPVTLGINAGTLSVGQTKSTTLYWLDKKTLNGVTITSPADESEYDPDDEFAFTCSLTFGSGSSGGTLANGNWSYCEGESCTPNTLLTDATSDLTGSDANGLFALTATGTATTTVTAHDGGIYRLRCAATDTDGSPTFFSAIHDIEVIVPSYGTLDVEIQKPDAFSSWNYFDVNLTINATVTCSGGDCGTVSAGARYNLSGSPDTFVSVVEGTSPFYILSGESDWPESLSVDLVSYYNFNEASGDLIDQYASNDGTNDGCEYEGTGHVGTSWQFVKANTDSVALGTMFPYGVDFTINCWIYKDSSTATDNMFGTVGGTKGINWGVESGGKLRLGDGVAAFADSTDTVTDGVWTMVTVAYDGSNLFYWINGDDAGTPAYTSVLTTEKSYDIGKSGAGNYMDGKIDEMSLWNRILTQEEIDDLYNSGAGITYESSASVENPQSVALAEDETYQFNWTLNVSTASEESYLIDVNFSSSLGSGNVPDADTDNRQVFLNVAGGAPPEDTCTYSSGNWEVACSDCCNITSNINIGSNSIILSGTGYFNVQANITAERIAWTPTCRILNVPGDGKELRIED